MRAQVIKTLKAALAQIDASPTMNLSNDDRMAIRDILSSSGGAFGDTRRETLMNLLNRKYKEGYDEGQK
jgi:hypothetical protein